MDSARPQRFSYLRPRHGLSCVQLSCDVHSLYWNGFERANMPRPNFRRMHTTFWGAALEKATHPFLHRSQNEMRPFSKPCRNPSVRQCTANGPNYPARAVLHYRRPHVATISTLQIQSFVPDLGVTPWIVMLGAKSPPPNYSLHSACPLHRARPSYRHCPATPPPPAPSSLRHPSSPFLTKHPIEEALPCGASAKHKFA